MGFCPRCAREQRCGCEECHTCGVRLVEKLTDGQRPAERHETGPARESTWGGAGEKVVPSSVMPLEVHAGVPGEARHARGGVRALLPTVMLVLGAAVLAVTLIEIVRAAGGFLSQGPGFSTGSVRRMGYLLGGVLYSGSVRLLTGYSLVLLGMLLSPPRPFSGRAGWQRGALFTGAVMGLTSAACLVAVVLLIVPGGGSASLSARSSLPPLAYSVPILLVLGLSLLWASYLMAVKAADVAPLRDRTGETAVDGGAPGESAARVEGDPHGTGNKGIGELRLRSQSEEHARRSR